MAGWAEQAESAEKYPTKAITLICPFDPGGSTDIAARTMSFYVSKKWGVAVNVVNKPGGNGVPALLEVYDSSPDGYTMLADGQPFSTFLGIIVKDLPFKVMDRTFIGITAQALGVLMVGSNSPYKTMADLVADAKNDPKNFTWACLGGVGGTDYLSRQFFKAIGVDILKTEPIMVKGGSSAAALVAGGHAKMAFVSLMSGSAFLQKGGTGRALLLNWHERDELAPGIPSAVELGYPGLALPFWCGVSAPPKTPSYIVDVWNKTLKEIQSDPAYITQLKKAGFKPSYMNSNQMREFVAKDIAQAAEVYETK
jgi:tripartite-type tricarboxylate transporter receptor subunit TctC